MTGSEDRTAALAETLLLLAVLFLGTNPVAVKVAVAEFPPMPFVAVRFTAAGLLLLGLVALLETGGRPGGGDLLKPHHEMPGLWRERSWRKHGPSGRLSEVGKNGF